MLIPIKKIFLNPDYIWASLMEFYLFSMWKGIEYYCVIQREMMEGLESEKDDTFWR